MLVPILGLLAGLALGLLVSFQVPLTYVKYSAIAILAAVDTLLGGVRAQFEGRFDLRVFLSGFAVNTVFAAGLTALGDLLGLDIYLGAVVAFSIRIFNNIGFIRRDLISLVWKTAPLEAGET
ncbi:MAG TPA: small basic family protein [bacterium]|nr:small basic family protein [bacterium]